MHNDINEKISQFLDNEIASDEAMSLLQEMRLDSKLKNKLLRYEAIGHALKTDAFLAPKPDFLDRIQQEIAQEPSYLLPQVKTAKFKPQHKVLALVASAAAVAVMLPQHFTHISTPHLQASAAMSSRSTASSERSMRAIAKTSPSSQAPINEQINAYLQSHNKDSHVNDDRQYGDFTKRAAYNQK
jgi:sigma-E factor negative regulatory protein RseA